MAESKLFYKTVTLTTAEYARSENISTEMPVFMSRIGDSYKVLQAGQVLTGLQQIDDTLSTPTGFSAVVEPLDEVKTKGYKIITHALRVVEICAFKYNTDEDTPLTEGKLVAFKEGGALLWPIAYDETPDPWMTETQYIFEAKYNGIMFSRIDLQKPVSEIDVPRPQRRRRRTASD